MPLPEKIRSMPLSAIKHMELLASELDDVVSLAQGMPSFPSSEQIREYVKEAIDSNLVDKYSLCPGILPLRQAVSDLILKETGEYYHPNGEIIITVGAMGALSASLLTITAPGNEIILLTPTYPSYFNQVKIAGCKVVEVPLDQSSDWDVDILAIKKAINPRTKAILLCYPNNPTGTLYTIKQLKELANIVIEHDLYLIVDEVYKYFIYDSSYHYFSLAGLPELRKHLMSIFGFSKTFALTGWRVGYVYADKSITEQILKVHDSLVTCAPVISQYAALAALHSGFSTFRTHLDHYTRRRDFFCDALEKMGMFDFSIPQGSYYVFAKIKEQAYQALSAHKKHCAEFCQALLYKTRVTTVPGIAFGQAGAGWVRFCFAKSDQELKEALHRLNNNFAHLRPVQNIIRPEGIFS